MTVFKEKVEIAEPQTEEVTPLPLTEDNLSGFEKKATDPITEEEKTLDIWEGLNRRKFITEYFDIGNIDGEFGLKMQTAKIDKLIRQELENRGYEKNIDNYKEVLREIEEEIGSHRLELFKRIDKLAGYASALNKLYQAKALKDKYLAQ